MPFDLSTAKPVGQGKPKFDLATAKPAGGPDAAHQGILSDGVMKRPQGAPLPDATPSPATTMDRVQAGAAGVNKGIAGLAGLPIDTALNMWDLAKAGAGYAQSKITGDAPSPMFDPSDRSQYPLSGEWNADILDRMGIDTEAVRPDDATSRYLHAAGTGIPGALTGGGGALKNIGRQLVAGVGSGVAAQGAADAGFDAGSQALVATAVGAGAGAARVPKKGPPLQPQKVETDAQRARAIDQKLLPSEVGDAPIGTFLEGVAGSQNVRRHMNKKNENTNTKLAADKIGADPKNMGKKSMDKIKSDVADPAYAAMKGIGTVKPDGAVHADIGALNANKSTVSNSAVAKAIEAELKSLEGPVDAAQLVERVRELRQQASFNQSPPQGVGSKPDPKKVELGRTQRKIADALDNLLERNASAMGQPETAKNYKAARKKVAQVNSVQDATVGRKVQASELAKQQDREVPLTEELGLIADAGEAFPHSTSRPMVGTETINDTNWMQNLVAPVVSRVLSSDTYQNSFGKKAPLGPVGPVSEYFDNGRPDFAPRGAPAQDELPPPAGRAQIEANRMAGDLELAGEGVAPMQRELSASTPPATPTDGVQFTPPNGTGRAPSVNLDVLLGLADDVSPRATLPGAPKVNDTGLSLVEDAPVDAGPARGRGAPSPYETIDFDMGAPDRQPFDYGQRFTDQRPKAGTQRDVAVNLAGDLGLEPEGVVPGHYGPRENGPDLAAELSLAPDDGPSFRRELAPELGADAGGEPLDQRFGMPAPTRVTSGKGYISYIPGGDKTRQITGAFVKPEDRGQGAGRSNLMKLVKDTAEAGETLNSDTSVSHDQLKVYAKLKKEGKIDFDVDQKAFDAAMVGKKPLKGSQPVIKNIRPGKKADGQD